MISSGCDNLEQVYLTSSNAACVIGSDGVAKAIGTPVDSNTTYYLVSEISPKGTSGQKSEHIRIYPMLVTENALLEWTFDFRSEATITIYNAKGEWIENIQVSTGEGHHAKIDTRQLLPGIYFVSLGNADFRYITKLVKL